MPEISDTSLASRCIGYSSRTNVTFKLKHDYVIRPVYIRGNGKVLARRNQHGLFPASCNSSFGYGSPDINLNTLRWDGESVLPRADVLSPYGEGKSCVTASVRARLNSRDTPARFDQVLLRVRNWAKCQSLFLLSEIIWCRYHVISISPTISFRGNYKNNWFTDDEDRFAASRQAILREDAAVFLKFRRE